MDRIWHHGCWNFAWRGRWITFLSRSEILTSSPSDWQLLRLQVPLAKTCRAIRAGKCQLRLYGPCRTRGRLLHHLCRSSVCHTRVRDLSLVIYRVADRPQSLYYGGVLDLRDEYLYLYSRLYFVDAQAGESQVWSSAIRNCADTLCSSSSWSTLVSCSITRTLVPRAKSSLMWYSP